MLFPDVPQQNRRSLWIFAVVTALLVTGLLITGVWLLLFDPQPTPNDRFIGLEGRAQTSRSGLEDVHAVFGELIALLSIYMVAWWSYRIRTEVSWPGVAAFVVLVSAVITGGMIRIIAVVRDNMVVTDVIGYWPIVSDDFDYVAVGSRDLSPLAVRLWLGAHLVSLLVVIAIIVTARRHRPSPEVHATESSWLDQLPAQTKPRA